MNTTLSDYKSVTFKIMEITPEWASKVLERHCERVAEGKFRQRTTSDATIDSYSVEIENGNFLCTHQGIAFDCNDDLLDGQHRLWAVKKSGKSIISAVSFGWPAEFSNGIDATLIDAIDGGRPRSVGTKLALSGCENATLMAATAKAIAEIHCGRAVKLSVLQIKQIRARDYARHTNQLLNVCAGKMLRKSYILAPLSIYRAFDKDRADKFAEQLSSLSGLAAGSPVAALGKYLMNLSGQRLGRMTIMRAVAYCIQKFEAGEKIERVSALASSEEWLSGLSPAKARGVQVIATGTPEEKE